MDKYQFFVLARPTPTEITPETLGGGATFAFTMYFLLDEDKRMDQLKIKGISGWPWTCYIPQCS